MKRRSRVRICRCCGDKFTCGPHNRLHQRYCGKSECRKASHRASARRYRRKKRSDPEYRHREVERVKAWRRRHPNFRRAAKARKKSRKKDLALRDFVEAEKRREDKTLRDVLLFEIHCLQGLVAQLTGAERDNIGSLMNRYYDKGKELFPEFEKQINGGVIAHGEEGDCRRGEAPADAGGIRVGRPPPGA